MTKVYLTIPVTFVVVMVEGTNIQDLMKDLTINAEFKNRTDASVEDIEKGQYKYTD